jgi:hypothetical protein
MGLRFYSKSKMSNDQIVKIQIADIKISTSVLTGDSQGVLHT